MGKIRAQLKILGIYAYAVSGNKPPFRILACFWFGEKL
jgi:hypothetical protein